MVFARPDASFYHPSAYYWPAPERPSRERDYYFTPQQHWPGSAYRPHPGYRFSPPHHPLESLHYHPLDPYYTPYSPHGGYYHSPQPAVMEPRLRRAEAPPAADDSDRVFYALDGSSPWPVPIRIVPAAAPVPAYPVRGLPAIATPASELKDVACRRAAETAGKVKCPSRSEEPDEQPSVRRGGAWDQHELLERLQQLQKLVDAVTRERSTSPKQQQASAAAIKEKPAMPAQQITVSKPLAASGKAAPATGGAPPSSAAPTSAPPAATSAPTSAPTQQPKRSPPTKSNAARTVQRWWRGWQVWGQQREALQTLRRASKLEREATALLAQHLASSSSGQMLTQKQFMEVSEMAMKVVLLLDGLVCRVPELKAAKKRLTNSALSLQDRAQAAYDASLAAAAAAAAVAAPAPLAASSGAEMLAAAPSLAPVLAEGSLDGPAVTVTAVDEALAAAVSLAAAAVEPEEVSCSDAPAGMAAADDEPPAAATAQPVHQEGGQPAGMEAVVEELAGAEPAAGETAVEGLVADAPAAPPAAAALDAGRSDGTAGTAEVAQTSSSAAPTVPGEAISHSAYRPEQPGASSDVQLSQQVASGGESQAWGSCSCCCHCLQAPPKASGAAEPAVRVKLMLVCDP